ncbi:MAG: phasin family protein [Candidatus Contendobacter sp.]|jgi:poly(hydroxyalkanoate) granule-associated protein|nr:phasin family protein [Gammaproteobacteria bacterium]MCC8994602.1 phasin family protein [Candidatus Contendobacter sp.]
MKADLLENQLTSNARDFARQIWLAGLGAFARTQEEGGKFFETLVQEGQEVDTRMKKTAEEKADQVKESVEAVKDKAGELRNKATGAWNKLEEVFQTRVARALRRLGVPTKDDIQQLFAQVEVLTLNIQELTQAEAEAKARKVRAAKVAESARIAEPTA